MDINTQFDFNSLKLQNTDVKITGIQKNRIIYLKSNNLISNHKSLSLNDITVYVDKVNNLRFTNLSLFKNSAFIAKETGSYVPITSKELHGDINSGIFLSNIISSSTSISCSEANFKEGQIQIKGDSEIFLKLYNFDSKSGYSIKLIDNQLVIENQGQQFIIAFDDSSVKILIENSQGSTIVLNSIVERLIPHQTTTIEIQSSFNSITRFSECNWPVRHNSIVFNGLGSSILELDNSNLPLRVNSAISNLTIRLLSKYASITSIQLPKNSNDAILIESNSSEKVVLNISKLYTYSNPLMANGNLIVSISSLFPRSEKTELKGSATYSILNPISSSITNLFVDNFFYEGTFSFLVLFDSKNYTKFNILNSFQSEQSNFWISIKPNFLQKDVNDQLLNEIGELTNQLLPILQFPSSENLPSDLFSIQYDQTVQIRGFTHFFSIFNSIPHIDQNTISLKIEYDIRTHSDRFCLTNVNHHSSCPADYFVIRTIDEAKDKLLHSKQFKLIILSSDDLTVDLTAILHESITICSVCGFDASQNNSAIEDTSFGYKLSNYNRTSPLTITVQMNEKRVQSFLVFELQNVKVAFSNEWNGQLTTFVSSFSNVNFDCQKLLLRAELLKIDELTLNYNGFYSKQIIDFENSTVDFIDLNNPNISLFDGYSFTINNSPKITVQNDQILYFDFQQNRAIITIQSNSDENCKLPTLFFNTTEICLLDIQGKYPSNYKGIILNELHGTLQINPGNQPITLNKLDDDSVILLKSDTIESSLNLYKDKSLFKMPNKTIQKINQMNINDVHNKLNALKKKFDERLITCSTLFNVQFSGVTDLRADAKFLCQNDTNCHFSFETILFDSQNYIKMNESSELIVNNAYYNETLSSIRVRPLIINSKLEFTEPSILYIQRLSFKDDMSTELIIPFSLNNRSYIEISEKFVNIPAKITFKYLNEIDLAKDEVKKFLSKKYLNLICGSNLLCNENRKWSFDFVSEIDMSEYEARCYDKSDAQQCIAIVSKDAPPFVKPTPIPIDNDGIAKEQLSLILTVVAVITALGAVATVIFVVIKFVMQSRKNRPDVIETNTIVDELNLEETESNETGKVDPSIEQELL